MNYQFLTLPISPFLFGSTCHLWRNWNCTGLSSSSLRISSLYVTFKGFYLYTYSLQGIANIRWPACRSKAPAKYSRNHLQYVTVGTRPQSLQSSISTWNHFDCDSWAFSKAKKGFYIQLHRMASVGWWRMDPFNRYNALNAPRGEIQDGRIQISRSWRMYRAVTECRLWLTKSDLVGSTFILRSFTFFYFLIHPLSGKFISYVGYLFYYYFFLVKSASS